MEAVVYCWLPAEFRGGLDPSGPLGHLPLTGEGDGGCALLPRSAVI